MKIYKKHFHMQTDYVIVLQMCKLCQSMLHCWWYSKQNSIVTLSRLKSELQTYASLYTLLVWIWVPPPPSQLCLSKDFPHTFPADVKIKTKRNPVKHSSPVPCNEAIPRQEEFHSSEELQVLKWIFLLPAITNNVASQLLLIFGD